MKVTFHKSQRECLQVQRYRYIWPALAWALAIFLFSTSFFSASHTREFIIPILHFLFPSDSMARLEHLHLVIRKFGHIAEYFVLCILIFRALRRDHSGWAWKWALCALLIAALYGCTDEFHQIFVPGRTPAILDVVIDTCGAILAQCFLFAWLRGTRTTAAPLAGD
jgi:VanZ family protein